MFQLRGYLVLPSNYDDNSRLGYWRSGRALASMIISQHACDPETCGDVREGIKPALATKLLYDVDSRHKLGQVLSTWLANMLDLWARA